MALQRYEYPASTIILSRFPRCCKSKSRSFPKNIFQEKYIFFKAQIYQTIIYRSRNLNTTLPWKCSLHEKALKAHIIHAHTNKSYPTVYRWTNACFWSGSYSASVIINNNFSSLNASESIAHEAKRWMGYWLRGHDNERNNYCFSKIKLVGQRNIETKHLVLVKARLSSFFAAKTLYIWQVLFATNGL